MFLIKNFGNFIIKLVINLHKFEDFSFYIVNLKFKKKKFLVIRLNFFQKYSLIK
jgi:hypothetical protein